MRTLHRDLPRAGADFYKGHGLGNDYLVFEAGDTWALTPGCIAEVCDRWRGVGADGIVLLLDSVEGRPFGLRMFNPDGSEFERSGNGLRILASHLARTGRVDTGPFDVRVGGDRLSMTVHTAAEAEYDVSVDMGRAEVGPASVHLDPDALDAEGRMVGPDGDRLVVVPVSIGNPHMVVFAPGGGDDELHRWGPYLTTHPALAHGANVQLVTSVEAGVCRPLIWERGVGRTSASGTSACAVAVAAVHQGLADPGRIGVEMEGGSLAVAVSEDRDVTLRGPVAEVCEGRLAPGLLRSLARMAGG